MPRHNFCTPDGRLAKFLRLSTLLDKSPLTSINFATFEKKRELRSPLPTQSKFLVFGKYRDRDSRTEMIDHSVERKFYEACHRL